MNLNNTLNTIENAAIDVAARVGPFIAPIPTAYAIGYNVLIHLAWPTWIAIVAGLSIEFLGLATVNTALMLRDYNASKRKSDPQAPVILAASLGAVYLIVAVVLSAILDGLPWLARWTPAIFPFLSLVGVTTLAIRHDHRQRLEMIAQADTRKRRERRERQPERTEIIESDQDRLIEPVAIESNGRKKTLTDLERAILEGEIVLPDATGDVIAKWGNVSSATGRRWKRKILQKGG